MFVVALPWLKVDMKQVLADSVATPSPKQNEMKRSVPAIKTGWAESQTFSFLRQSLGDSFDQNCVDSDFRNAILSIIENRSGWDLPHHNHSVRMLALVSDSQCTPNSSCTSLFIDGRFRSTNWRKAYSFKAHQKRSCSYFSLSHSLSPSLPLASHSPITVFSSIVMLTSQRY